MSRGTVVSLCDRTGNIVRPWIESGYSAITVDLQPAPPEPGRTHYVMDVRHFHYVPDDIVAAFAFPPCTDLAVSGARWFRDKGLRGLIEALELVEACRAYCDGAGVPSLIENPVSTLSTYWRKPDHIFHPHHYTGYCEADNYTKKTCAWTGGGFIMPVPNELPGLGAPDDRIHKASPGADRGDRRGETPMGFARAVFHANDPRGVGRAGE